MKDNVKIDVLKSLIKNMYNLMIKDPEKEISKPAAKSEKMEEEKKEKSSSDDVEEMPKKKQGGVLSIISIGMKKPPMPEMKRKRKMKA